MWSEARWVRRWPRLAVRTRSREGRGPEESMRRVSGSCDFRWYVVNVAFGWREHAFQRTWGCGALGLGCPRFARFWQTWDWSGGTDLVPLNRDVLEFRVLNPRSRNTGETWGTR